MSCSGQRFRPHHPLFDRFDRWKGVVSAGVNASFLGVFVDVTYANWNPSPAGGASVKERSSLHSRRYQVGDATQVGLLARDGSDAVTAL
jgi:hypothetical protein